MIVKIPEDIYEYESKLLGAFTTRQLICCVLSFLVIAPSFILLFWVFGTIRIASLVALLLGCPVLFCGFYKKNGLPLEKIMIYRLKERRLPQRRGYVMKNVYEQLVDYNKECRKIESKSK